MNPADTTLGSQDNGHLFSPGDEIVWATSPNRFARRGGESTRQCALEDDLTAIGVRQVSTLTKRRRDKLFTSGDGKGRTDRAKKIRDILANRRDIKPVSKSLSFSSDALMPSYTQGDRGPRNDTAVRAISKAEDKTRDQHNGMSHKEASAVETSQAVGSLADDFIGQDTDESAGAVESTEAVGKHSQVETAKPISQGVHSQSISGERRPLADLPTHTSNAMRPTSYDDFDDTEVIALLDMIEEQARCSQSRAVEMAPLAGSQDLACDVATEGHEAHGHGHTSIPNRVTPSMATVDDIDFAALDMDAFEANYNATKHAAVPTRHSRPPLPQEQAAPLNDSFDAALLELDIDNIKPSAAVAVPASSASATLDASAWPSSIRVTNDEVVDTLGQLGDPAIMLDLTRVSASNVSRLPIFLRCVVIATSADYEGLDKTKLPHIAVLERALLVKHIGYGDGPARDRVAEAGIILRGKWMCCDVTPGAILHIIATRQGSTVSWDGSCSPTASFIVGCLSASTSAHTIPFNIQAHVKERPIIVDDTNNALIVQPDMLLAPTKIAGATHCLRRTVLQELMGDAGADNTNSQSALLGSLKHELFEAALHRFDSADKPTPESLAAHLASMANGIVRSPANMQSLYAVGETDERELKHLHGVIPGIVDWIFSFSGGTVASSGSSGSIGRSLSAPVSTAPGVPYHLQSIVATEDSIWSPIWGIKGIIDATVNVTDPLQGTVPGRSIPLEFKTGKCNPHGVVNEHRAQMALYALLVRERYGDRATGSAPPPAAESQDGLLVYLSSAGEQAAHVQSKATSAPQKSRSVATGATPGSVLHHTEAVPTRWVEQSDLLVLRNTVAGVLFKAKVAAATGKGPRLPPMIQSGSKCSKCYMLAACAAAYVCQELPTTERSACQPADADAALIPRMEDLSLDVRGIFTGMTGHASSAVQAYVGKWLRLLDLEAAAGSSRHSRIPHRDVDDIEDIGRPSLSVVRRLQPYVAHRSSIWRIPAVAAEKRGCCASRMVLMTQQVVSDAPTLVALSPDADDDNSPLLPLAGGNQRYDYEFRLAETVHLCDDDHARPRNLMELDISVGEYVVASGNQCGPYGIIQGIVMDKCPNRIVIRGNKNILDAFPSMAYQAGDTMPWLWRIDRDELGASTRVVKNNLVRFICGPTVRWDDDGVAATNSAVTTMGDVKRQRLLVALVEPRFDAVPNFPWSERINPNKVERSPAAQVLREEFEKKLNSDQRAAVSRILSARDYVCLLGMPGTGKTSTIAFVVRCLVSLGKSVLISSHTHSAVDTVLLKLKASAVDVIRLGRPQCVHPELRNVALTENIQNGTLASVREIHDRLQTCAVVGVTCLGINHPVFLRRTFDCCIVDEASQIPEPVCLGPIRVANTFVLVGDHNQLPPLVLSPAARAGGMDTSLFKRLSAAYPSSVVALTQQYRMNRDIQLLTNQLVYHNALQCGNEIVAASTYLLPLLDRLPAPCAVNSTVHVSNDWLRRVLDPATTVALLDCDNIRGPMLASNSEVKSSTQRPYSVACLPTVNPVEASIVSQLLLGLVLSGGRANDVGVICPYRSQLRLLRHVIEHTLASEGIDHSPLEIETVDRYQGRDKPVIIISMARWNDEADLGMLLTDARRLNVALTRAKCKLIIVCSRSTLARGSSMLSELVALVERQQWQYPLPTDAHTSVYPPPFDVPWRFCSARQQTFGTPLSREIAIEKEESSLSTHLPSHFPQPVEASPELRLYTPVHPHNRTKRAPIASEDTVPVMSSLEIISMDDTLRSKRATLSVCMAFKTARHQKINVSSTSIDHAKRLFADLLEDTTATNLFTENNPASVTTDVVEAEAAEDKENQNASSGPEPLPTTAAVAIPGIPACATNTPHDVTASRQTGTAAVKKRLGTKRLVKACVPA